MGTEQGPVGRGRGNQKMGTRVGDSRLNARGRAGLELNEMKNSMKSKGTSLAVQWLRLCASMHWAQVLSLVRELRSTCHGTWTKKNSMKPKKLVQIDSSADRSLCE